MPPANVLFRIEFEGEGFEPFAVKALLPEPLVSSAQSKNRADQKSLVMLVLRNDPRSTIETALGDDCEWWTIWDCMARFVKTKT